MKQTTRYYVSNSSLFILKHCKENISSSASSLSIICLTYLFLCLSIIYVFLYLYIQYLVKELKSKVHKCYSKASNIRSSHRRCSVKVGVLKNFTKFTGKHMSLNLFVSKVAGLRTATLAKKRL